MTEFRKLIEDSSLLLGTAFMTEFVIVKLASLFFAPPKRSEDMRQCSINALFVDILDPR